MTVAVSSFEQSGGRFQIPCPGHAGQSIRGTYAALSNVNTGIKPVSQGLEFEWWLAKNKLL